MSRELVKLLNFWVPWAQTAVAAVRAIATAERIVKELALVLVCGREGG